MRRSTSYFVYIASAACLVGCVGEFVALFVLGAQYPGYNQLKDTMSALGASISPVSDAISLWWCIAGILFALFGVGFRMAFADKGRYALVASVLIILYGLGEGIGSGAFKADHVMNGYTLSSLIHNTLGGFGVVAILVFPAIMPKVLQAKKGSAFSRFSSIVFVVGIMSILLFLFRYLHNEHNFFVVYKGLWQRLFMLNTYAYMATIAIITIRYNRQIVTHK
jgi:hypothetical protein